MGEWRVYVIEIIIGGSFNPTNTKNSLIVEQWLASVVDGGPKLTQHGVNGVSAVYVDGHIKLYRYIV